MSQSTEEHVVALDEAAMLGPRTHVGCCETEKLVTFCGIVVPTKTPNWHPSKDALTCSPCVEKHEIPGYCPRFEKCRHDRDRRGAKKP